MQYRLLRAASCAVCLIGVSPTYAQGGLEEVVVTSSKVMYNEMMPHTTIIRRADHLITRLRVVCDTRDESQRRSELRETLRSMIRTAGKTATISMSVGETVVDNFTENMLDTVIQPDAKVDTSYAVVVVKTTVAPDDTFDSATARIKKFIAQVPKSGRTEILKDDKWDLTIIGPEQYRDEIIKAVADDAKHTAEQFGPTYNVEVDGLQQQVTWYQIHPLDLALYVPYSLKVTPAH
jgi:hypothetical protein